MRVMLPLLGAIVCASLAGCQSRAPEQPADPAAIHLRFSSDGTGAIDSEIGSLTGAQGKRWLGLDSTRTAVVKGEKSFPHAAVLYDDSTVMRVNGRPLSELTLTLNELMGWPTRVQYVRDGTWARAVSVDISMPKEEYAKARRTGDR